MPDLVFAEAKKGEEMNNDQFCKFLASAPPRREASDAIRARLIEALQAMPDDEITMQMLAAAADVHLTTIWHRVKKSWKLKPVGFAMGKTGHRLDTYDRDEILMCLNAWA